MLSHHTGLQKSPVCWSDKHRVFTLIGYSLLFQQLFFLIFFSALTNSHNLPQFNGFNKLTSFVYNSVGMFGIIPLEATIISFN
jgi:hypothetical protein